MFENGTKLNKLHRIAMCVLVRDILRYLNTTMHLAQTGGFMLSAPLWSKSEHPNKNQIVTTKIVFCRLRLYIWKGTIEI